MTLKKSLLIAGLLLTISVNSFAIIDTYQFDNPRQEAQYRALIDEFRCPKCQNQNLAGSDAPIAQDLKKKTYDMVKAGQSDGQIRAYMSDRYGDFISYKPPLRPSTWVLWFLPPLILLLGLFGWWLRQRHAAKRLLHLTSEKTSTDLLNTQHAVDDTLQPLSSDEQTRLANLLNASDNQTLATPSSSTPFKES